MNFINNILFVILLMVFKPALAISVAYPSVSSIKITSNDSGNTLTVGLSTSNESWNEPASKLANVGCSGCKPALVINFGGLFFPYKNVMNVTATPNMTYGELANMLNYSGGGQSYSINLKPYIERYQSLVGGSLNGVKVCADIVWSSSQNSGATEVASSSLRSFPVTTNSTTGAFICNSSSTITDLSCTVANSRLDIDFGNLTAEEIDGKTGSATFDIKCGKATDAIISLSSGIDSITLSNGIIASLDLDNKALGSNFILSKGSVSHKLNVKLSGTTSQLGTFTGSGTLNINVQ